MCFFIFQISVTCLLTAVIAQDYQDYQPAQRQAPLRLSSSSNNPAPTPVPILKQINKHNEDGSYTYGYEGADGSFKIETKLATGEVKGKYGYTDETGKVRVVEYGANKYGFQPSGEGITVAPPTLVDETTGKDRLEAEYDDEQPQRQYTAPRPRPQQQTAPQRFSPAPQPQPRPQPQQQYVDYDDVQSQQQHQQPQQKAQRLYTNSPIPSRAQIPGSVPIDVVYSARQSAARPDPEYTRSQTFAAPQQTFRHSQPQPIQTFSPSPQQQQQPRPQPQPQQQYQPQQPAYTAPIARAQPSHQQPQGRSSSSLLDQLAKDFALPAGGSQPLHDISFGYY